MSNNVRLATVRPFQENNESSEIYENPAFTASHNDLFTSSTQSHTENTTRRECTLKDSAVYSWQDINAFAKLSANEGCISRLPCFKNGKSSQKPKPKQILNNVSGEARPGEILAIMGASGAGKTTLLNILTFRNTGSLKVTGSRTLNNVPMDVDTLTLLTAYIQQDDIFIGTLTPREHLKFQALLRMDKKFTYKERMARVEEVIYEMGLTGCADTIIGIPGQIKGLSGGQQKRLSVASEIITDPKLLICDEPTTGLDFFMAQSLVKTLKMLASKGKTIICTIHQPASDTFALFDKLLLLSEGRVAYNGKAQNVANYFSGIGYPCPENYNPADFFIHTLAIRAGKEESCLERSKEICDIYDKSDHAKELQEPMSNPNQEMISTLKNEAKKKRQSPYKASWFAQFKACLWRSWIGVMKNPMILKVQLFQTIFISLLIGVVYFGQDMNQAGIQNINGCIFIIMANLTMSSVFPVTNVFWQELPVFLRDHFNGMYSASAYYLAKTVAELPIYLTLPVIYISIIYFMVGFNSSVDRYLIAVLIAVLISNVGSSVGYMASTITNSFESTMALIPIFIMPFMLFGGSFLNKDSIPVYLIWLRYLSWFLYGNEAMNINQWKGVENIDCEPNSICISNGQQVLESLSFSEDNFWTSLVALGALLVGARFISFLGLALKAKRSKN